MVEVRGTPASGKSTLALLLHHHILDREPTGRVHVISSWSEVDRRGSWKDWMEAANFTDKSVVIIDEAQMSYSDEPFWGWIKLMDDTSSIRVIAFVSYGSTTSANCGKTPFPLRPCQRVNLHLYHNPSRLQYF
jgi:hypothetical protein